MTVPPPRPTADRAGSWAASLRRLHALVRSNNEDLDLDRTLAAVCLGLLEGLGFGVAVINLVVPDGDPVVVACEGDDDARAALLGRSAPREMWDEWMAQCDEVGSLLVTTATPSGATTCRRGRLAPRGRAAGPAAHPWLGAARRHQRRPAPRRHAARPQAAAAARDVRRPGQRRRRERAAAQLAQGAGRGAGARSDG